VARDAPDGLAGRGRAREWKALIWGGVTSDIGWLSLCGAPPRRWLISFAQLQVHNLCARVRFTYIRSMLVRFFATAMPSSKTLPPQI
jgi:hypothetical protein